MANLPANQGRIWPLLRVLVFLLSNLDVQLSMVQLGLVSK